MIPEPIGTDGSYNEPKGIVTARRDPKEPIGAVAAKQRLADSLRGCLITKREAYPTFPPLCCFFISYLASPKRTNGAVFLNLIQTQSNLP